MEHLDLKICLLPRELHEGLIEKFSDLLREAVLVWMSCYHNTTDEDLLEELTCLPKTDISAMGKRLRENKLWDGNETDFEWAGQKQSAIDTAFCLECMVASGDVVRSRVKTLKGYYYALKEHEAKLLRSDALRTAGQKGGRKRAQQRRQAEIQACRYIY